MHYTQFSMKLSRDYIKEQSYIKVWGMLYTFSDTVVCDVPCTFPNYCSVSSLTCFRMKWTRVWAYGSYSRRLSMSGMKIRNSFVVCSSLWISLLGSIWSGRDIKRTMRSQMQTSNMGGTSMFLILCFCCCNLRGKCISWHKHIVNRVLTLSVGVLSYSPFSRSAVLNISHTMWPTAIYRAV